MKITNAMQKQFIAKQLEIKTAHHRLFNQFNQRQPESCLNFWSKRRMNHTEERIVQLLKEKPLTAQEVAAKTNLNVNYIHGTLKNMETKGRIASSAMSGSRKYNVRPTTADEMSRRRAAIKRFGTVPILI